MDNQQASSIAAGATNFSVQTRQQGAQTTVAQLLDDKNAMEDWTNNIEKIRQKESEGVAKHAL